jgi:quercetin dioxygenase-like cupin family protein
MTYVYGTDALKRYRFPTHVNGLVYDRTDARHSEAFVVELEPGGAPPLHKHDDTEQVFYVLEGRGMLTVGEDGASYPVKEGDVVVLQPGTRHAIRAEGGGMRYLAVDCFGSPGDRKESTWDEHARALCAEQGWDYDAVVGGAGQV